ncbi:hypothetical protein OG21DRAFT_1491147 [Imleria badia]|nr:hypothetical protein OG21DRAFT_1491147 [Imleria badia]
MDITSPERWLSPLAMEEGTKTDIFQFIPKKLHPLMAYNTFGNFFSHGASSVRSESVSEVKTSASAIFKMNPDLFMQGYARNESQECRALIIGGDQKYTKFAPILYPDPQKFSPASLNFLQTPVLVKILKVCLFGRASLSGKHTSGPQTKARIWELRVTTPGMIAAAAVFAIFVLSGDTNFYAIGDKSGITYLEYHKFYREILTSQSNWAKDTLQYYNNHLFPATSSVVSAPQTTRQRAIFFGGPLREQTPATSVAPAPTDPLIRNRSPYEAAAAGAPPAPARVPADPSISNRLPYKVAARSVPPAPINYFPPTSVDVPPAPPPPSLSLPPAPAQNIFANLMPTLSVRPANPSYSHGPVIPGPATLALMQPIVVDDHPPIIHTAAKQMKHKTGSKQRVAEGADAAEAAVRRQSSRNK